MFKKDMQEFEQLGEETVQQKVDQGLYAGRRLTAAKAWLNKKDRERKGRHAVIEWAQKWLIATSGWIIAAIAIVKCSIGSGS